MSPQRDENGRILRVTEVIGKKRDGERLDPEEIEFFVQGVVSGAIQSAQTGRRSCELFLSLSNTTSAKFQPRSAVTAKRMLTIMKTKEIA